MLEMYRGNAKYNLFYIIEIANTYQAEIVQYMPDYPY